MKLYSKLGSIPKTDTDGTEGWEEVPLPPTPGPGEELVWWSPPGWVVRPVMPAPVEGHCWSWSQSETKWVLCVEHNHGFTEIVLGDTGSASSTLTISGGTSADTIITI